MTLIRLVARLSRALTNRSIMNIIAFDVFGTADYNCTIGSGSGEPGHDAFVRGYCTALEVGVRDIERAPPSSETST